MKKVLFGYVLGVFTVAYLFRENVKGEFIKGVCRLLYGDEYVCHVMRKYPSYKNYASYRRQGQESTDDD